ncbi:polysaccharide deacetylase family protein [uncultured Salegentibacter sp.]|uniref:polysaccharide deacetylase family protein n=1 Tax=uncultured Salegentibacter sp. TaxID=259320 RepID=UPI0025946150|nr:polysaccharide deacetylase family protein [uncultured Salegentibacter sp.]
MNIKHIRIIVLIFMSFPIHAQTNISITIDDVPNTRNFKKNNYQSVLLQKLDSLRIPIAIFINEKLIYKTNSVNKNFELLNNWIQRDYVTAGNHSFSHSRYSEIGYPFFKLDIEKGEGITRELTKVYNKPLQYFRFPYNDLGKDTTQHKQIGAFLKKKKYISTPFTVESSDWMFNYVYEHYLEKSDFKSAAQIGKLYVNKTLEYFQFFDSLSTRLYGRKINQIYLCHDNLINENYLPEIIDKLKKQGNNLVTLEKSLEDKVYEQESHYYKKGGISWLYRWIPTENERMYWMKNEPNMDRIINLYNRLVNQVNAKNK